MNDHLFETIWSNLKWVAYCGFVIYGLYAIIIHSSIIFTGKTPHHIKKINNKYLKGLFAWFAFICLIGGIAIFFKLDQIIKLDVPWLDDPYRESYYEF